MPRPSAGDCADYYFLYIDQVPGDDVLAVLEREIDTTCGRLQDLSEEQALARYAEGKWTVKEVVAHLVDTERVFGYRCLSFARRDPCRLPGFDQDQWNTTARADDRRLVALLDEYRAVRRGHLHLFRSFDDETRALTGTASEVSFTVGCIPWILAGHELHHRKVLEEKYLGSR